jgi:mono/diheme cytochrome c family protein
VTSAPRNLIVVLAIVVIAESAALAFLWKRSAWARAARTAPIQRGGAIAQRLGCFGCHGPGGVAPIANPGAKGGEVPGWGGGTWMMWNRTPSDVRAWILDGHPPGREPDAGALIRMPAYRSRLTASDADDLVAFVLAVSHFGAIDDPKASAGHETAYRLGCFGCHGPEGRGLIMNPGSFKGFIPPWDGDDYTELVRDDAEFAQWVRAGVSDRFRANPAARVFLDRQAIRMPAFGDRVSDAELADVAAYVAWVRKHPR